MIIHKTTINLAAEATHEGTNDIIAAVIDKLGELTHGCALITKCDMTIEWTAGGTYQTNLTEASVKDIAIDSENEKKRSILRERMIRGVEEYFEFRGTYQIREFDLPDVMKGFWDQIASTEFEFNHNCRWDNIPDLTIDRFNYLMMGLDAKYRVQEIDHPEFKYEFVDITKEGK